MNVLICGFGKGSFEMRGRQIGAALGARVTSDPTGEDWAWADVCILIKKTATTYARAAWAAGVPIVWDVLDCWGQPHQNGWSVEQGVEFVQQVAKQIKPSALIGATQVMADAIGGVYIPHHCRIGLAPTPPREQVQVVAYDGSERYLGTWEHAIREACRARGWSFVINPPDLSQADILVAFRDGYWDGPICRAWKSGVKYVNAISAGRPIIGQPCAAWEELMVGSAAFESPVDLPLFFENLGPFENRSRGYALDIERASQFTVDAIAETYYRPLLERVCAEAPCAA